MFCPTRFFSNSMQIHQFEKKSVGQNMNLSLPLINTTSGKKYETRIGIIMAMCVLHNAHAGLLICNK